MSEKTSVNITELEEKVEDSWESFLKAQRTSSQKAITFGRKCQKLKMHRKEKTRRDWMKYFNGRFPWISLRTAQRSMKISRKCNLIQFPSLGLISQDKLNELCILADENDSVGKFLKDEHGIDATGEEMDEHDFTKAIHNFLKKQKSKKIQEDSDQKEDGDDGQDNDTKNSDSANKGDKSKIPTIKSAVPTMIKNIDFWLQKEGLEKDIDNKTIKAISKLGEKIAALQKRLHI